MSPEKLYSLANGALIFSLVLGVVATFTIVITGNIKERKFKLELVQSSERTANAELELAKLKDSIRDRALPSEKIPAVIENISKFKGKIISISYNPYDTEAFLFTSQISSLLRKCELYVSESQSPGLTTFRGICVNVGDKDAEFGEKLFDAFIFMGFKPIKRYEIGTRILIGAKEQKQ